MIQTNLICICSHIPCGAERVVRVPVRLEIIEMKMLSEGLTRFKPTLTVDVESMRKNLEGAGWSFDFHVVLCPTHKDPNVNDPK